MFGIPTHAINYMDYKLNNLALSKYGYIAIMQAIGIFVITLMDQTILSIKFKTRKMFYYLVAFMIICYGLPVSHFTYLKSDWPNYNQNLIAIMHKILAFFSVLEI